MDRSLTPWNWREGTVCRTVAFKQGEHAEGLALSVVVKTSRMRIEAAAFAAAPAAEGMREVGHHLTVFQPGRFQLGQSRERVYGADSGSFWVEMP